MTFKNIEETISWIHSLNKNIPRQTKDTLIRIEDLLNKIGKPQKKLPPIIQIAGTNGKGSTAKFIQTILTDFGLKTGLFVSPFIIDFNERIQIDNKYISDTDLIYFSNLIKSKVTNQSEFEVITAIAILYFSQSKLDAAIFEVGIGGKYDSTNVLDANIAVITSVGLDHTELLGDSIEKIAEQKSGIIKENTKAVLIGRMNYSAKNIIKTTADTKQIKFGEINTKLKVQRGYYQMFNASLAWSVVKIYIYLNWNKTIFYKLIDRYKTDDLIKLLDSAKIPARMEKIQEDPLIVLDGAHNEQAIKTLANSLIKDYGNKIQHIIYGNLKSHDIKPEFFAELPLAQLYKVNWIAHKPTESGQFEWKILLNKLINSIDIEKEIIVVTGSLYFTSQVRKYLTSK
ncbi:MAG: bifunctional folylpolyglutamate synthase/dihydrofolate synthase [Lactobacillaceae bacterium]|jgi:dihydrofolate synthase/folylpolyglutamate synthase|nr:bifunctional folylpolyglutamate synthase/dihydrofolate synthase [Lactobacillaceae bacterium]